MTWTVHCADVLNWCAEYEGPKFHAVLCDPPYELAFMGKSWDNSGVTFQPATWAAIAEHLHPGGFIMAFGGSRTYHRLAVAAEDAGLMIHPAIVHLQGQGFPKATRIDTQIDKAAGAEREVIGKRTDVNRGGGVGTFDDDAYVWQPEMNVTAPATPFAAAWAGHRYGLQALKPCAEFILVAQKPYEGRPVDCITSTGAGALNIDGARVATGEGVAAHRNTARNDIYGKFNESYQPGDNGKYVNTQGRWPPNVCLSHLPGCERLGVKRVRGTAPPGPNSGKSTYFGNAEMEEGSYKAGFYEKGYADPDGTETVDDWACIDGCPAKALGEQSGERKRDSGRVGGGDGQAKGLFGIGSINQSRYLDQGTAARFYPQHDWQYEIAERLAGVTPFRYVSKAGRAQRDAGLEGFERQANDFQRETSGLNQDRPNREGRKPAIPPRNPHPTVKNIELTKWLATLLLPPPEYAPRRVLIPFGGVMSEAIGAVLAGWDEVEAIEMEEEYIPIGESRLRFWADWAARGYDDPAAILKATKRKPKKREKAQMELL